MTPNRPFLQLEPYSAPEWAQKLSLVPTQRVALGHLPTPVHQWHLQGLPKGCQVWIKQDSYSGMELSGNKIRKLEFLMAEALKQSADCIVTLGGIQSNHARATAVAATMLGLECHLILRNSHALVDQDPGLVGNLLIERMAGAHIHQVSKQEYARLGQLQLANILVDELRTNYKKKNPYVIPVGGSSALGTWGYLDCIAEVEAQLGGPLHTLFDDIVMACGSGATSGGLALGAHLTNAHAGHPGATRVTAYAVCDSPQYFYDYIQQLFNDIGATPDALPNNVSAQDMLRVVDVKGAGYAISKEDELETVARVAQQTGVLLDPVYTGKAVHGMLQEMAANPKAWEGKKVLFVHTGGLFGMYDKVGQLQGVVEKMGGSHRLQVGGEGGDVGGGGAARVPGGAMV